MIGYRVTATGYDEKAKQIHSEVYSGWFEGDVAKKEMAEKFAAKQVVKQLVTKGTSLAVGGPVKGVATVVDIVTKPITGMGEAAGKFIANELTSIVDHQASQALVFYNVKVILQGDFVGEYMMKKPNDLKKLPSMLDLIPRQGDSEGFMGESVRESVVWAHRNFLRHLPISASRKAPVVELTVNIKL